MGFLNLWKKDPKMMVLKSVCDLSAKKGFLDVGLLFCGKKIKNGGFEVGFVNLSAKRSFLMWVSENL